MKYVVTPRSSLFASLAVALVLTALLALLVFLARCQPFWEDEILSIFSALSKPSTDFLLGRTGEGLSAPLYFLGLKTLAVFHPAMGRLGFPSVLWFRLIGILPAWALVLLAYHVARTELPAWGRGFALAFAFALATSFSVIAYSWQARQYALWMLLSGAQAYLLLAPPQRRKTLIATSALLCLTTQVGALQTMAGVLVLLARRLARKDVIIYVLATLPFVAYSLLTQLTASKVTFFWPGWGTLLTLAMDHVRWWQLTVVLASAAAMVVSRPRRLAPAIVIAAALAAGAGPALAIMLKLWSQRGLAGDHFIVSDRYFSFLFPQAAILVLFSLKTAWRPLVEKLAPRHRQALLAALAALLTLKGAVSVRRSLARATPVREPLVEAFKMAAPDSCVRFIEPASQLPRCEWQALALEILVHNSRYEGCGKTGPEFKVAPENCTLTSPGPRS